MERCVVFANGDVEDYNYYKSQLRSDDFVICADGAVRHCIKIDRLPDIWLGDFDSCNYNKYVSEYPELKNVETVKLNTRKDETDTHRSCMYAIDLGYREIVIWGAVGSRLDHSIGNIHILEYMMAQGVNCSIENSKNTVNITDSKIIVSKKHKYISLIPLDKSVKFRYTKGLEYSLSDEELPRFLSRGISNEFTDEEATVCLDSGTLLIVQSDD